MSSAGLHAGVVVGGPHPGLDDLLPDALAPEVVAHLMHCHGCRQDRAGFRGDDGACDPFLPDALEPRRFEITGMLGRGGMGAVLRARDRALERDVAIKLLHPHVRDADEVLREEARLTARLEHPSIIAVHHVGALRDGRPYYVMKVARGRTLRAAMADDGAPPPLRLRRLVSVLQRVCEGVAFAHASGIVHRDLKPDNVALGAFDELTIVDFGLSRAQDTRIGRGGTPGYLAPELVHGAATAQPAADVYALGVMLGDIALLCGEPPLTEDPALVAWSDQATAVDPAERPTARELADGLRDWLEGARRLEEALALVASAAERQRQASDERRAASAARARATALLAALPVTAGPADKAAAWALEDEADQAWLRAETLDNRYEHGLASALARWPDLPEARAALVDHWRARLVDAERRRDLREIARWTALLRTEPSAAGWLDGAVPVSLAHASLGVRIVARRFDAVGRRLVPGDARSLGAAPVTAHLPPGSWLLCGSDGSVVPVHVERGGADPGVDPTGRVTVHARPDPLGSDACWVPAGWAVIGGDEQAADAFPRLRVWVDAFVIGRFPVTAGAYLAFVEHLRRTVGDDAAHAVVPRLPGDDAPMFPRGPDGAFRLPDGTGPDYPVVRVDLAGARAYCRWRAAADGVPWRLPTEIEREKAARSADGRTWPWGDHFEPAWARTVSSLRVPALGPVHEFPDDESVYGVRGLAGGVRDWTGSAWRAVPPVDDGGRAPVADETGEHQVVRGGAWTSAGALCRPAARFGGLPTGRYWNTGFRLARSVP